MRISGLLHATCKRFRPASLAVAPLFLGLLFLIRWFHGESTLPIHPHLFLGELVYLAAFFALSPWGWQWTGDEQHRARGARGWVQAIVWNTCWLGGISVIHHFYRGPEPQLLTQWSQAVVQRSILSPELSRIVIQLPLALFIGWFMADREAVAQDCADSMAALKNMENQEREARNHVLLAQLGPHVLYNSLGALSELVHEDAARAEQALLDVASFYRGLTGICDRPWIRLEEERRFLEQYLAIEQLRLGPRLSVSWRWPDDLKELHMPPLLLLPLVENAIKHGIAPHRKGGELRVEAHRSSMGELNFRVTNSGKPLGPPDPQGTGLNNLRTRLSRMGTWLVTFDLRAEDQLTIAELQLKASGLSWDA